MFFVLFRFFPGNFLEVLKDRWRIRPSKRDDNDTRFQHFTVSVDGATCNSRLQRKALTPGTQKGELLSAAVVKRRINPVQLNNKTMLKIMKFTNTVKAYRNDS